jgi:DNA primase
LYTEVRKQKSKQTDDFRKKELREKTKPPVPQPELPQIGKATDFVVEELEFLRFLLKHCQSPLFEIDTENPNETEIVTVGEFMVDELENDELVSEQPLFQTIFEEVKENLENKDFDPWKYFVYHPNGEVSKLATDLLSEKFIESKRWTKAGAYTEKEEDILDLLIPRIVHEYKLRRIRIMLDEIESEINAASVENDFDQIIEAQSKYMNLKRVEKHLSDQLGNRTII